MTCVLCGVVALISAALDFEAAVADINVELERGAADIVFEVFISLSIVLLYPVYMD